MYKLNTQTNNMAMSVNTETPYRARSISLPSRPHPQVPHFDEHFRRLSSFQAASTSISSSSLINSLGGLKDLYDCLDQLLLLQPKQQSLIQSSEADDQLDASLRLLDVCASAKDALLKTKESIQGIQSALRRRGGGEVNVANEVNQYMSSRKKIKQVIRGSLKDTKTVVERCSKNDAETASIVGVLREMEALTANIFGSLLSYIATSKAQAKKSKWSVVSKLLHHAAALETSSSEFDEVDVAMMVLESHNSKGGIDVVEAEKLTRKMVNLEAQIQELDEVVECLYRRLVKTRAILLNILSA